jgi:hypothetical protein
MPDQGTQRKRKFLEPARYHVSGIPPDRVNYTPASPGTQAALRFFTLFYFVTDPLTRFEMCGIILAPQM